MRRAIVLAIAAALSTAPLLADTPPELFAKAKEQFKLGAYPAALETLGKLEQETEKPENAKARDALRPALYFYRGASYAALGRGREAREQFAIFLTYQPNASLDPAVYSKKVIASFEETRRSIEKSNPPPGGSPESPSNSLAQSYGAFRLVMQPEEVNPEETWADGPARHLLTAQERRDYQALSTAAARSEFVTAFWKARDPKPETADNEFREEFEKRVSFADSRFTQEETRGAMTDRGMVFILLGPPTYVGRKPLTTGDDTSDATSLSRHRASDLRVAAESEGPRKGTTAARAARKDAVTGPGTRVNDPASSWREVWHYRRENLPKRVPYLQVDFEFVTKRGYGENVLQRESNILDTLERARANVRETKV